MYKVFINEHLVIICDQEEKLERSFSELWIYNPQYQEIKILIDWLLQETISQKVVLVYKSLQEGWISFQASFQFIEAAGGLVKNAQGQTLMIYRLDKWDLPKGKIEKGEAPKEAAIREVEEECNLDQLKILSDLSSSYHIYPLGEEIVLKKTYWYLMQTNSNKALIPQTEEGIEQVKWMNPEEVSKAALNTYPSLKHLLT